MTLAEIYNAIKGSIGVNGYVGQLGPESFIEIANTALMYTRTYLGRKRGWQLVVQKMTAYDTDDTKTFYFRTQFPIVTQDVKFYCATEVPEIETGLADGRKFGCACGDHIDLSSCDTCMDCCEEDDMMEMDYVQPGSPLKAGQFTITGGSYGGGVLGNKIKAKFGCTNCCDDKTIYLVYRAGPRLLKCMNDDIPLPDYYIEPFKLLLKGLMSTNIFNGQSNKETLWFTFAKEIIEGLDSNENNIPSRFGAKE